MLPDAGPNGHRRGQAAQREGSLRKSRFLSIGEAPKKRNTSTAGPPSGRIRPTPPRP